MTEPSAATRQIKILSKSEWQTKLKSIAWNPSGKVLDIVGTRIEAVMPNSRLSMLARLESPMHPDEGVLAEVVGFRGGRALLLPYGDLSGIAPGAQITPKHMYDKIPVGDFLLGHVISPFMEDISGKKLPIPPGCPHEFLHRLAPNPLEREKISQPLVLGIRSLDGLLTMGQGQRIGIMAGSGVGKSVLLGRIAKESAADINVIGLIGERGREVRQFLDNELGPEGLRKSVVVVITSDQSPLMKIRGAKVVTTIAEYFASQGKKVLLMLDSLTRVAQAQREIGLAVGEPPTSKGYPPSVYALLPRLLERCGPQPHGHGSISGIYTVLVDGDDFNDPMPDAIRSILDGHINLSRDLAAKGHFPAIEVLTSVSRVMQQIVSPEHLKLAQRIKSLMSEYRKNYDFIQFGSYQPGTNPLLDQAILLMGKIEAYLHQDLGDSSNFSQTLEKMIQIFTPESAAE